MPVELRAPAGDGAASLSVVNQHGTDIDHTETLLHTGCNHVHSAYDSGRMARSAMSSAARSTSISDDKMLSHRSSTSAPS